MKCALCGFVFEPSQETEACKACPLHKKCKLIRCPNCGYETPPEPEWLKKICTPRSDSHETDATR